MVRVLLSQVLEGLAQLCLVAYLAMVVFTSVHKLLKDRTGNAQSVVTVDSMVFPTVAICFSPKGRLKTDGKFPNFETFNASNLVKIVVTHTDDAGYKF